MAMKFLLRNMENQFAEVLSLKKFLSELVLSLVNTDSKEKKLDSKFSNVLSWF